MSPAKPIGDWLKHLHNLLEAQLASALAEFDLTRRHWQVLDTVSRRPLTRHELREALTPFWTDGAPNLAEVLDDLAARGWTHDPGETMTLTAEGRAAHAAAAERIGQVRAAVVDGLTPEQYAGTIHVLSHMARNVEADLARRSSAA
ncbi:MAG: hypothetical protein FWJ93_08620 [Micromonosporaceae bacterium]